MHDSDVAAVRAVYDASADAYVHFAGTELRTTTEAPLDLGLLEAFADQVVHRSLHGRVADVGCGPGRVAAYLAGRGLEVVGVDVSTELLARGRAAHPGIDFAAGVLDRLPLADASLAAVVAWYSIIHTSPEVLDAVFAEVRRVLGAGGDVLVAFQAGNGEALRRDDAHGTGLSLTSYRHRVEDVTRRLEAAGLAVRAIADRTPEFVHETTPQAFVFAHRW